MFSVINVGDPKWVAVVMGLPKDRRDIHFDQRMLCPYVAAYNWRAHLALTETEKGYIAQPVLVAPNQLRHAYNFGGPVAQDEGLDLTEHANNLAEWAKKQDLTTEYCTLVPHLAKDQIKLLNSANITPSFKKLAVVVDVNDMKVRGTTRRLANKAHGIGIEVMYHPSNYLSEFIHIYNSTMDRVNAKEHWRFSNKWFETFFRFVKPHMMLALHRGNPVAGCMVAYSHQYPTAYYHFAGCLEEYLGKGVDQLMVLAACEFIKSQGVDKLFLGGGVTDKEDDGLLVFKSGFSPLKQPIYSFERTL